MANGKGWQIGLGGLSGAGAGAGVGSLVAGPVGTAVGAGVGAIAGIGAGIADWRSQEKADAAARRQQRQLARDLSGVNANYDAQMASAARAGGQRQLQAGAEGEMAAARVGLNAFQTQSLADQARGAAAEQTGMQLAQQAGMAAQIAEARRSGLINEYTASQALADNAADNGTNYMGVIGAIGQAAAVGMGIKGQLNARPMTMDQRRAIGSVRDANRAAIANLRAENEVGDPGLAWNDPIVQAKRIEGRQAIRTLRDGFAQENTLGRTPQYTNPQYEPPVGYAGRDVNVNINMGSYPLKVGGYDDSQIIADGGAALGIEGGPVSEPVGLPPGIGSADDGAPVPAPAAPAPAPASAAPAPAPGQNGAPVGVPAGAPVGSPAAAGGANRAPTTGSTGSPRPAAGAPTTAPSPAQPAPRASAPAPAPAPRAPAPGQPAPGGRIPINKDTIDRQGAIGTAGQFGQPYLEGDTVMPWMVDEENDMVVYDKDGKMLYRGTDANLDTGPYGAKRNGQPGAPRVGPQPAQAPVDVLSEETRAGRAVRTTPENAAEYGQADAANREQMIGREAAARWKAEPAKRAVDAVYDEKARTEVQSLHQSMMSTLTNNGLSTENARAIANKVALDAYRTRMRPELTKIMDNVDAAIKGNVAFYNGQPISQRSVPGPMNDVQDLIVEYRILERMLSEVPAVDDDDSTPVMTSDELEMQWRDLFPHSKAIPKSSLPGGN